MMDTPPGREKLELGSEDRGRGHFTRLFPDGNFRELAALEPQRFVVIIFF